MIEPDWALIGLRTAVFASVAFVFGTSALAVIYPSQLVDGIWRRLLPWLRAAAVVLLAATAAMMPVLAASAGDGWQSAVSPDLIESVAFSTRTGLAILIRAVLAMLLVLASVQHNGSQLGTAKRVALIAALYIVSFAFTGHALLHDGVLGLAHQANHIAHVLAGSFWIGALVPLLLAARELKSAGEPRAALTLLSQFARAGTWAVMVIAATGAVNTALILGKLPLEFQSLYQRLLAAKLAAVAVMLALALANRVWLVPGARNRAEATGLLASSIFAETMAGAIVVILVAAFGTMEPV